MPWDFGMLIDDLFRNMPSSFADDLQISYDCVHSFLISLKTMQIESFCIFLNFGY